MTGRKINGHLDHLRENLEIVDEQIANVRKMSKKNGKDSNALQWAKVLRDLVELRNTTLVNIKAHVLGRDETGSPREPPGYYGGSAQVKYERDFQSLLAPWTHEDLKLTCEDCGSKSEEVATRHFSIPHQYYSEDEYLDLCPKCYENRRRNSNEEENRTEDVPMPPPMPASKKDIETVLQTGRIMIRTIKTYPPEQRIAELQKLLAEKHQVAPGMESAYTAYREVLERALEDEKAKNRAHGPVRIVKFGAHPQESAGSNSTARTS